MVIAHNYDVMTLRRFVQFIIGKYNKEHKKYIQKEERRESKQQTPSSLQCLHSGLGALHLSRQGVLGS
jgi:hypothetical protein